MRSPECDSYREAVRLQACGAIEVEEAGRLETHRAACAECRRYAEEMRAATTGLRWLADRPAEPSPGFRSRWTRAVEDAAQPGSLGETVAALFGSLRALLLRNLRPALGVASLWILTLLFRLSAPDLPPATPAAVARSPLEIARALQADPHLLTWHSGRGEPMPSAPRPAQPPQPRSQRLPAQPAAQFDLLPDAHATADRWLRSFIARSETPEPLLLWTT